MILWNMRAGSYLEDGLRELFMFQQGVAREQAFLERNKLFFFLLIECILVSIDLKFTVMRDRHKRYLIQLYNRSVVWSKQTLISPHKQQQIGVFLLNNSFCNFRMLFIKPECKLKSTLTLCIFNFYKCVYVVSVMLYK